MRTEIRFIEVIGSDGINAAVPASSTSHSGTAAAAAAAAQRPGCPGPGSGSRIHSVKGTVGRGWTGHRRC